MWLQGLKAETRKVYGRYLRRLFAAVKKDPDEVLSLVKAEAHTNDFTAYSDLCLKCGSLFTERGRHMAVYALRSYLFANGIAILPKANIETPSPVKPETNLTWDQALAIGAAASKPYNLVFKLMLHAGWGAGEFFRFNTADHWDYVKKTIQSNPKASYVRINFPPRKKSKQKTYSLVPKTILDEILANVQVPIRASHGYIFQDGRRTHKTVGVPLDLEHRDSARVYLEKSFNVALRRAPVIVEGKPTVHELRDTFRTRAIIVGCANDAAEFAMHHSIDELGYKKCYNDEKWMWSELSKLYGAQRALTKYERLRQYASDLGFDPDEIVKQQVETKVPRKEYKGRIPSGKERRQSLASLTEEERAEMLQIGLRTRLAASLEPSRRSSKTARNGGTLIHASYETRIVGVRELVPLLNEGYDLVKELADGRVIVRKPLDDEE
jgi:integrase